MKYSILLSLLIFLTVMFKRISGHSDGCDLNDGHAMCLCTNTNSIFCTGIQQFPKFKDEKLVKDIIIVDSPLLFSLEIDRKMFENLEDISLVYSCSSCFFQLYIFESKNVQFHATDYDLLLNNFDFICRVFAKLVSWPVLSIILMCYLMKI